ncbi:cytochrome c553 [Vibrio sp. ES.051]|uniref:c-type cytochrome n=1 Tax=Vibrio sp. ES.051 TaxID=1761909 RepID=UPI000BF2F645|nr:cytochrome c [Vibrio sp. ES.051]PFG58214.1 cytochrome c553 [Vibrio sp. ES.051]
MLRFVFFASLLFSSVVSAESFGDADKGKIKSPSCVYCHGTNGIAENDAYPSLAGQNAPYLYNAMKAYQSGEREGPLADMMEAQLRMLDDEDLRDVAAFFAEKKRN